MIGLTCPSKQDVLRVGTVVLGVAAAFMIPGVLGARSVIPMSQGGYITLIALGSIFGAAGVTVMGTSACECFQWKRTYCADQR